MPAKRRLNTWWALSGHFHYKLHLRVLELVMDSVPSNVYIYRHLDVAIML